MFANQVRAFRRTSSIAICLLLAGCAQGFYEKRAEMIKEHVEAFNANLKADRVEAAVLENERIEALASQVAESIRKRGKPLANSQVDQEWKLLKTAIEAAVKNWLALGQHLTINKRYDQAIVAYQRLIYTYLGDSERTCREGAPRAKRDLDILSPRTSVSAPAWIESDEHL